jgi:membrane-associated phospholipid phosphatase
VSGVHKALLRVLILAGGLVAAGLPTRAAGKHPYPRLEEVAALDDEIMRFVIAHRTPALTALAEGVENAGDSRQVLWLVGIAALAVVVALRAWRVGAAAVVSLATSWLAVNGLKAVFQRPRPEDAIGILPLDGWSMPSGHAARVAAVSVAVLVSAGWSASGERRVQTLGVASAVAAANVVVGVFLVYLGTHWATDVLAGWALGVGVGWAVGRLTRVRLPPRTARARSGA